MANKILLYCDNCNSAYSREADGDDQCPNCKSHLYRINYQLEDWRKLDEKSKEELKERWRNEIRVYKQEGNHVILDNNTAILAELLSSLKRMEDRIDSINVVLKVIVILCVLLTFMIFWIG